MTTSRKIRSITFTALITIATMGVVYYLALPAWNLRSPGFWWFICLTAFVFAVIATIKTRFAAYDFDDDVEGFHGAVAIRSWIATGVIFVAIIVMAFISAGWFHSSKAYSVADVQKAIVGVDKAFVDLADTDTQSKLPLVDMDTAIVLGDKKIAGLENAPWYDVDKEYNLIEYQGNYYRLSVIDYADFFKYGKAKNSGIPGYVLVSCTPENGTVTQTAEVVRLDEPIRYSPGAYWGHDLRRHLRSQFPGYMFDKSFLEINEEGIPYWVTGVKRPTCGVWGVVTVESFVLTNAQTGESVEYTIDKAPSWIDHVFSLDYLMQIAGWHYAYENGWWNSWIGQTGVWKTSYSYRDDRRNTNENGFANFYGYSSTVVNDRIVFYTGLTAANAAESNLGWLTIDISTGKMTEYSVVGAEESSAQAAVEQLVSAQRYQATFPLPANVGGEASYVMCLKGDAGLVQGYTICNVANFSIAVQAATLPEAVDMYLARLGQKPTDSDTTSPAAPATRDEVTPFSLFDAAKVVESYSVEINGTTQYYYVLDDGSLYCVVRVK